MQRLAAAFLIFCLAFAPCVQGYAKASKKPAKETNDKYASIVIDAQTGAVISGAFVDKRVHPASLTKVMTLMLLFEALESGTVRLNDKIMISQNAAAQQPSKLGLTPGSSIRVEDAILAVVTKSANDIAYAISEHLAGSEDRFALRMTRRAHDIGMTKTTFRNAHGLHDPEQVTTARDMATLARYVLVRYPNYYRYFSTKQFTYRGKTYTNHNRLMQTYPGMDGFKTGFINASGFNLIASAKHGDQRLIGVVFGGKSWKSRNDHMATLLNSGFAQMGDTRYAQKIPADAVPVVELAQQNAPARAPVPLPRPVFKTTNDSDAAPRNNPKTTSLASLDTGRKFVAPANTLQLPPGHQPDTTEQAVASVRAAVNRGDYSEITGEGDMDAANARRVETGLLSAAVYKGEHEKVQRIQAAALAGATAPQILQMPAEETQAALPPILKQTSLPPAVTERPRAVLSVTDLWSVQIGAYTSRLATDDALRIAHGKLPAGLSHASPIVAPLKTSEGILFRARLGGLTQAQANDACRYFRDCLPLAPR